MFKKIETQQKRDTIRVVGKKGSYSIPVKILHKQPIQQQTLYEEYWNGK